ncbi:MAG: beta strand repeat-containing protein, partial [Betaproteobacteria bacterium]
MVSEIGAIVDNTVGEGANQENIVVQKGTLTQLKGASVGSRFVGGAIDLSAQRIGGVQATSGGAFVQVTGATGGQVRVGEVLAAAEGADLGVTVLQGGMVVDIATAGDQLNLGARGEAGQTSGNLVLGQITAGGDLSLSNDLSGIAVTGSAAFVRADGTGATSVLKAGGDIDLSNSGNDFATLRVDGAQNASVTDRDGADLGAVTVTGNLNLRFGSAVKVLQGQSVLAGQNATLHVDSGELSFAGTNTVRAQGADLTLTLGSGGLSGLGSSTLSAARDVVVRAQGQVGLGGSTTIQADRSILVGISGGLSSSGVTTMTARTGRIELSSTAAGNLALAGITTMSAAAGIDISLAKGQWTTATGASTNLRATSGAFNATLSDGSVTLRGNTTIEADSIAIRVAGSQAGLSAQNSTTITADVGNTVLSLSRGALSLQGSSSVSAARDLTLEVTGQGTLGLAGASTLRAGSAQTPGDLTLSLGSGNASFANASNLTASQDIRLTVGEGNWRTSGATVLKPGRDIHLTVGKGTTTLTQRSVIESGGSVTLNSDLGVSASGLPDILGAGNVSLTTQQGGVALSNTTNFSAQAGQLGISSGGVGDLSLSGGTTLVGATGVNLSVAQGNLATAPDSTTTVRATTGTLSAGVGQGSVILRSATTLSGDDVAITIGTGNLQTESVTKVSAVKDIRVTVGAGDISLTETSAWTAGRDQTWQIATSGSLTMQDASTEIRAERNVRVDVAHDVRIDYITAGNTIDIRSANGAILDNTKAETDLLVSQHLNLDAAKGIGVPWSDNLNIYITGTIGAVNRISGGINLQNQVGFTVAESGIVNRGDGDIVLISGGSINYDGVEYGTKANPPKAVVNMPSQRVFVVQNHSESQLLEQWGN